MEKQSQSIELRNTFIGWQCRIRQHSMRKQEGRPADGIRATVRINDQFQGQMNTVIVKRESAEIIKEFRFMVQKTVDPKERYDNVLKYLCEYYYQYPKEFSPCPTALFSVDSDLADKLIQAECCELTFFQANQRFILKASATSCDTKSNAYQATYWHNHLFNSNMPGIVKVINFEIDWQDSASGQVTV